MLLSPKKETFEGVNKQLLDSDISRGQLKRAPVTLSWHDLQVTMKNPPKAQGDATRNQTKYRNPVLLRQQSGSVNPGQMLAIMGPSGAGKSTLLSTLGMRVQQSKLMDVQGRVLINSKGFTQNQFRHTAAYIMQNDYLLETMSVRETIEFAARIRMNCSEDKKQRRIDKLVRQLKLEHCQNTLIGGHYVKGVSGGERRRAAMGAELVCNPNLLLLDEPTSGLDSFTAFIIVNILRELATERNKTIVLTIHQPSSEIFALFDRLQLMRNGEVVYSGKARDIVPYLRYTSSQDVPLYCNPADLFMELLTDQRDETFTREKFLTYLENKADGQSSQDGNKYISFNGDAALADLVAGGAKTRDITPAYANSHCLEIWIIFVRCLKTFVRNPVIHISRFLSALLISLMIDIVWWHVASDAPQDITNFVSLQQYLQNFQGLVFMQMLSMHMNIEMALALLFPAERLNFLKESNSGMYRVTSYYFGRMMMEAPYTLILPWIMNILQYFAVGLDSSQFVAYTAIMMLFAFMANAAGIMVGTLFRTSSTSLTGAIIIIGPFIIFSGVFNNFSTTPDWVYWTQYISPFRYCLEALMRVQLEGKKFRVVQPLPPYVVDVDPLSLLGFDMSFAESLGGLVGFVLLFNVLALLFLYLGTKTLL